MAPLLRWDQYTPLWCRLLSAALQVERPDNERSLAHLFVSVQAGGEQGS